MKSVLFITSINVIFLYFQIKIFVEISFYLYVTVSQNYIKSFEPIFDLIVFTITRDQNPLLNNTSFQKKKKMFCRPALKRIFDSKHTTMFETKTIKPAQFSITSNSKTLTVHFAKPDHEHGSK